jgi:hypothetical protein
MKTIIKTFLLFSIILFLNTSCYTYVSFNKSAPPEIMLDNPKNSIAFINTFDYTIPDSASKNENKVYRAGITEVIDGLKTFFANNEQIDFHVIDTLVEGKAPAGFSDTISADSVKNICRINNSSMLLGLEAFDITIDSDVEVEESDDGSVSRTSNYYLIVNAGLSLYSNSGDLIDRSWVGRSELYKSRWALAGIAVFSPSIYKAEKDIRYLAGFIGEDYVNKFYPGTETVNRKIYVGKGLLEADNYCMEQNWDKAIELLRPLAESSDPKIARKAANNLSVAYEAAGNEKAAEYWYNKSR